MPLWFLGETWASSNEKAYTTKKTATPPKISADETELPSFNFQS
jgi:hypothetical protein